MDEASLVIPRHGVGRGGGYGVGAVNKLFSNAREPNQGFGGPDKKCAWVPDKYI